MRKSCLLLSILLSISSLQASCPKKRGHKKYPKMLEEVVITPQNYITTYMPSTYKFFDLIHTKLTVMPVFKEKKLYGIAELTLAPHFYDQNELILDAKSMIIDSVLLVSDIGNQKLNYTYDSIQIKVDLEKYYTRFTNITILVYYVAQPYLNENFKDQTGRGLYFIDTEDKNPYKPAHMWTQGEEEASSFWFPTLDAINQKSTQEIIVTLDTNLISLSNGLMITTKDNGNGTKTDYWKQDKPHSPYLFFLAIGDYYKNTDYWHDIEVSAYTFPKYKDAISEIFKNMPEMMEFYSAKLGVDFPWDKMANIISFDYTAGAMENSSAIIYYDKLFCNKQQLIDGDFDWIISHELFHQWFGDLVTAESWANLTLNESFADYGEYLWYEYKKGKDEADMYGYKVMNTYLRSSKYKNEPIINYYYENPHDLFDEIRYEKGGRVLHMLRNYVGEDAFYKSLNRYLTQNKFKNAELSDIRIAFEDVTGEDLNWFFNQWWLKKGHPILDISHYFDDKTKTIELSIIQKQSGPETTTYRIPTKVDIYIDGRVETKIIDINDRIKTFYFPANHAPQLINFDADKVLLCEKNDNLSVEENIFKFNNAPLYLDKLEAVIALSTKQKNNAEVQKLLLKALQDKHWSIREEAVKAIIPASFTNKIQLSLALQNIINTDSKPQVREEAVKKIGSLEKAKSVSIFENVLQNDSSFIVLAAALNSLNSYDKSSAYQYAQKFSNTENADLIMSISNIFKDTTADHLDYFKKAIWLNTPRTSYTNFKAFGDYLEKANNLTLEKGILFLNDIYKYEESDYNTLGANQLIQNLIYHFEDKAKKDKLADIKLQIVKKTARKVLN